MRRWFVFFFLVAVIAAISSFGGFDGSLRVGETAGPVGVGKALFLSMIAIAGLAYAGWMLYASRKQTSEPSDREHDFEEYQHGQHDLEEHHHQLLEAERGEADELQTSLDDRPSLST